MPDHPLTPDEYRRAEGIDPAAKDKGLYDSSDETLDELEELAEKTLPETSIPERVDAAKEEAGIVDDHAVEQLSESVEAKVYVEWGKKTSDLMAHIRDYFELHPDHRITLELRLQYDEIRAAIKAYSDQHHDDPDYLAQETQRVLIAYDKLKKILAILVKEFGEIAQ